jgi:hypothetical protein
MKSIFCSCVISAFVGLISSSAVMQAAIIVIGPTSTKSGSFQITEDITFTITSAGRIQVFVLDEWVTNDGTWTFSAFSASVDPLTSPLRISINNAPPLEFSRGDFVDNPYSGGGNLTLNDGYIALSSEIRLAVGDTVTLKAGTYGLYKTSGFNPEATQVFTGNMFATDVNGFRRSNIVSVPEPGAVTLFVGSITVFTTYRRR